ncbi:MAG: enoyl-CoA hydratase/isomerase family protein [Dehalococcoidia bacterium]
MSTDAVLIEKHDSVAVIMFNRPERLNAWGADIGKALMQRLQEAEADDEVRGVVLTGNGRAFSAGADLKNPQTHSVDSPEEYLASHRDMPVFDTLSAFPKPIVSAVNGYAIGIGCLVPLCCDFILAGEQAVFCLPQTSLGILPAYGGTLRLARFVGQGNALNMALTARKVGAEDALRMGIATHVYPQEQLLPEAIATMRAIAQMPVHAVRLTRESLRFGYDAGLEATQQADIYRFMALAQTNDRADRHESWRHRKELAR